MLDNKDLLSLSDFPDLPAIGQILTFHKGAPLWLVREVHFFFFLQREDSHVLINVEYNTPSISTTKTLSSLENSPKKDQDDRPQNHYFKFTTLSSGGKIYLYYASLFDFITPESEHHTWVTLL